MEDNIALHCPYCTVVKEPFNSLANLSQHVQTFHGPAAAVAAASTGQQQSTAGLLYACQLCSLRFGSLPALQQHTLSAHSLADVLRRYCPPVPPHPATDLLPTDLSFPKKEDDEQEAEEEEEDFFNCPHCPVEFTVSELAKFQSHVADHLLTTLNEYNCSSCSGQSKPFSSVEELHKHQMDIHAQQLYRCSLCRETFDSKMSIQVHLALEHGSESKLYRCTACPAATIFRSETEFHQHIATVHTSSSRKIIKKKKNNKKKPVEQQQQTTSVLNLSLNCAYCGDNFKSRNELEQHMKTAHQPPTVAATTAAASSGTTGRVKCNICDQLFPSASALAEHRLTHCKVSGAAICAQCRVPLPTEEAYYAHLQSPPHGPNVNPPLACLVCRQTLTMPFEVQLHARFHTTTANSNESTPAAHPIYPCCLCHRRLESTHLVANGIGTFVCKDCITAHHQHQQQLAVVPRSFQCIKCQEIFATEAEIQAHVASHLLAEGCLHPCRLCGRQFDTPLKLKKLNFLAITTD